MNEGSIAKVSAAPSSESQQDGPGVENKELLEELQALRLAHTRHQEALKRIAELSGDPVIEAIALSALSSSPPQKETT